MRVLFIYPSIDCPPGTNHGLACMSGVLKQAGHEVKLIHVCDQLWPIQTTDEILQVVRDYQPGIIGFSAMSQQFDWCCDAARAMRQEFKIPLCVGGVHCTMVPDEVVATNLFDYVCVGEGEYAFLELVNRLERGADATTVPNMRLPRPESEGGPIINPVGAFPELDTLAPQDYELFDLDHIISTKQGWMSIITSRGCPYKCTYCFNKEIVDLYKEDGGAKRTKEYLRHFPIDRILGELRWLKERCPQMNTLIFDDDLFTLN
ncbi:MAG: cobalamin-dependent protein, partial [Planctomycetota bacterium]